MLKHNELIYTGGGYGGSLPGIPARDLTSAEVQAYGREALLASGLYREKTANKAVPGGTENKLKEEVSDDGRD
jgi:hypothetical protein